MAKVKRVEYDKELQRLREWIKPGDTVYTVLEHVSRSGMQRTIRVVVPYTRHEWRDDEGHWRELSHAETFAGVRDADRCRCTVDHLHPNHAVSVVTGYSRDNGRGRDGIKIGGCGMDMGFALVHALSERLYGGKRCDCGRWYCSGPCGAPVEAYTTCGLCKVEGRFRYAPDCPKCRGTGNVIGTGYQCLGKGKCPSNYHTNHRDRIRCEGTRKHNPHGPDSGTFCYTPDRLFSRGPAAPDNWPKRKIKIGGGKFVELNAACLVYEVGEAIPVGTKDLTCLADGSMVQVCPTCKGVGDLPNPAGPQRFDLEHFDGYAIRHRWL